MSFFSSFTRVMRSRWGLALLATILCVAGALAARKHASPPFGWFFLLLACLCMAYAVCLKNALARYAFLLSFSVLLAFSGMEFYLQPKRQPSVRTVATTQDGAPVEWSVPDKVTGYKPRPDTHIRSVRKVGDTVFYDVEYTSDEHSRRITPKHPGARKAVLFFGCSYAFGEGLNDQESIPYVVGEKLGPDYQVFNLGYSGYGPHQFLALLQSARLDDIWSGYEVTDVFFLSIAGHELRSAGYSFWDRNGPRFILKGDRVEREGTFAQPSKWRGALNRFFARSALYSMAFQSGRKDADAPFALQKAILLTAGDVLRQKVPAARFTVLDWPGNEHAAKGFQAGGLDVRPVASFLPGYAERANEYAIKDDGHPNAHAAELVADGVAAYILKRGSR